MLTLLKDFIPEKFWTPFKANSYGLDFRCVMSDRSDGKTTNVMIDALKDYNKNKKIFVYVRRYEGETVLSKDLLNNLVKEDIKTTGDKNGGCKFIYDKEIIGYIIPLSKQKNYKSVDFGNVGSVIYDEFTLDRTNYLQRYIPNEIFELNNLLSSIFRLADKYKVWLLGNNLDFANPFFEYYDIPDLNVGDIYTNKERGLYVEIIKPTEALVQAKENTPIAKLNKGKSFYNFMMNNELHTTVKYEIREKRNADKLYFSFIYGIYKINVYLSYACNLYIELSNNLKETDKTFIIKKDGKINYVDIKAFKQLYPIYTKMFLKNCFTNRYIQYDDKKTPHIFNEMLVRYFR